MKMSGMPGSMSDCSYASTPVLGSTSPTVTAEQALCKTGFSSRGAAVNLLHFSLNPQKQEASDFLCWDGLPQDPTPQP